MAAKALAILAGIAMVLLIGNNRGHGNNRGQTEVTRIPLEQSGSEQSAEQSGSDSN